ncbi:hypothetical protein SLA2020_335160 [Shorea laevis]
MFWDNYRGTPDERITPEDADHMRMEASVGNPISLAHQRKRINVRGGERHPVEGAVLCDAGWGCGGEHTSKPGSNPDRQKSHRRRNGYSPAAEKRGMMKRFGDKMECSEPV